jgi:hypothetical protein
VWILDNLIHDNGEDAVQVNFHGDVPDKEPARHVYIGRNDMYGDRENALDLKICEDVVVSENRMSGYVETHTSSGEAVVVHQDQPTDDYPHPRRVWVLNNEIFDSRLGVVITGGEDVYVVGNLLRDIRHEAGESYDPASIYSGGVAVHARNSGPVVVASNTIVRCDSGVTASADLTLSGNLIAALAEPQSFHLNVNAGSDHPVSADHDLYYQPGGSARVLWGGTAYEVDELRAAVKQELHGLEADPLLADMAAGDFHLTAASPAVDAGDLHAAYSDFLDLYGLNIAVDLDGGPRPYNRLLDIGADEWRE